MFKKVYVYAYVSGAKNVTFSENVVYVLNEWYQGGICHSVYRYTKANNKYIKDYDKNKESSCIQYWDVNNLYGQTMWQNLPVNNLKCIKNRWFHIKL